MPLEESPSQTLPSALQPGERFPQGSPTALNVWPSSLRRALGRALGPEPSTRPAPITRGTDPGRRALALAPRTAGSSGGPAHRRGDENGQWHKWTHGCRQGRSRSATTGRSFVPTPSAAAQLAATPGAAAARKRQAISRARGANK